MKILYLSSTTFSSPDIKIAICTSDSREGTEEFLTKLGLESMVDLVLCGDDKDSISKPNPHNALFICEQLGVSPSKTIMVMFTKIRNCQVTGVL